MRTIDFSMQFVKLYYACYAVLWYAYYGVLINILMFLLTQIVLVSPHTPHLKSQTFPLKMLLAAQGWRCKPLLVSHLKSQIPPPFFFTLPLVAGLVHRGSHQALEADETWGPRLLIASAQGNFSYHYQAGGPSSTRPPLIPYQNWM